MVDVPGGERARRRAAAAKVGAYREAELAELLERVRDGFARYDEGELDAFELDDRIHRYKRAAQELWKFCAVSGGHVERVAGMLELVAEDDDLPDWWEAGSTRRRR